MRINIVMTNTVVGILPSPDEIGETGKLQCKSIAGRL